jgi:hypothetical protein
MPDGSKRAIAVAKLIFAPVWIPVRAAASVLGSALNILTLGQISVGNKLVDNNLMGRVKAIGCSVLSIVTTPLNVAVEGLATIANAIHPSVHKIDLVASQLWTGFVTARFVGKSASTKSGKVESQSTVQSMKDLQVTANNLARRDPWKLSHLFFEALDVYSRAGDLSAKTDVGKTLDQGAESPITVGEIFKICADPELSRKAAEKRKDTSPKAPSVAWTLDVVDLVHQILNVGANETKASQPEEGTTAESQSIKRVQQDLQIAAKELARKNPLKTLHWVFKALDIFSRTGDLSAKVDGAEALGQESSGQPVTVGDIFRATLDPSSSIVFQMMDKIRKDDFLDDQPGLILLQEVVDLARHATDAAAKPA